MKILHLEANNVLRKCELIKRKRQILKWMYKVSRRVMQNEMECVVSFLYFHYNIIQFYQTGQY